MITCSSCEFTVITFSEFVFALCFRFPLYAKGKEKFQFNYGVFLLNKNISQVTLTTLDTFDRKFMVAFCQTSVKKMKTFKMS